MTRYRSTATLSGALLSVVAIGAAGAQTSIDRAFDSSPKSCSEVRWSQQALDAFPSIGEACQSIEERNGKTYVKLEGEVEEVENGGKRIRVDFEDGSELTFTPTPRTGLYIDGERTDFADLNEGTNLNFYIPEDRLQAELQPDPQRLSFLIVPLDVRTTTIPAQERSAARSERQEQRDAMTANAAAGQDMSELPSTAGPLPVLAAAGAIFVLLGAGASLRRKLR
jgi:hypothetical protein